MKTTINLPDPLLDRVRERAAREGTTVRALMERGLRQVLAEQAPAPPFRLRRASFRGEGLRPELESSGWDRLRELAYDDRGG